MTEIVLTIPRADEWVSVNQRLHWRELRRRNRTWREAGKIWARKAKLRGLPPSHVVAELVMLTKRRNRIDPANYQDTAKAVIDGMVDAGVWPDDSSQWVIGPDMRLGDPSSDGHELLILRINPAEIRTPGWTGQETAP